MVSPESFWRRARPKSVIQRVPRWSISRLAGLMSRWIIPTLWACSMASAAWMPRRAAVRKNSRVRVEVEERAVEGALLAVA